MKVRDFISTARIYWKSPGAVKHQIKIARGQAEGTIDPKFFDFVSQMAHWAVMYSIAFTLAIAFGSWRGLAVAGSGEVPYAAWHEFYWDPRHENAATRGSDFEDFFFLLLGFFSACIMYAIFYQMGWV